MGLFGNKTIYFVDSENVNEKWIEALTDIKKSDEIIVFYTEKSTHASYENISKIADGDVNLNWVKCFTGTNALDFQLSTELGYRIAKGERNTFVIISNDKGYDAIVNYWVVKGIKVSRLGVEMDPPKRSRRKIASRSDKGKETVSSGRTGRTKAGNTKAKAVKKVDIAKVSKTKKDTKTASKTASKEAAKTTEVSTKKRELKDSANNQLPKSLWKRKPSTEMGYVEGIGKSVSVKELSNYHMVLTNLLGQETGTRYYHQIKDDKALRDKIAKTYIANDEQRLDYLVRIFLSYNNKGFTDLQKILNIVKDRKCDSLNNFYKLLTENFREEKGRTYYNIFKGIYSVLKSI